MRSVLIKINIYFFEFDLFLRENYHQSHLGINQGRINSEVYDWTIMLSNKKALIV